MTTTRTIDLIDTLANRLKTLRSVVDYEAPAVTREAWDAAAQVILVLNEEIRMGVGGEDPDVFEDPIPLVLPEGAAGETTRLLLEQFRDELEVEMIQWMETTLRPRLYRLIESVLTPPATPGP